MHSGFPFGYYSRRYAAGRFPVRDYKLRDMRNSCERDMDLERMEGVKPGYLAPRTGVCFCLLLVLTERSSMFSVITHSELLSFTSPSIRQHDVTIKVFIHRQGSIIGSYCVGREVSKSAVAQRPEGRQVFAYGDLSVKNKKPRNQ